MICRVLLLLQLTCSVCGILERRQRQSYQAEENSDITVGWRFSSKVNISIPSLKIHCLHETDLKVFYHLDHDIEESQHEQFAGRVRCNRDALTAGQVKLLLAGVRTDDSGWYLCRMVNEEGKKDVQGFSLRITERFVLNVTSDGENRDDFFTAKTPEGIKHTKGGPEKEVTSEFWNRVISVLGVALGAFVAALGLMFLVAAARCGALPVFQCKKDPNQECTV